MLSRLGAATLSEMETGTVVVLPSATFPVAELERIAGIQFYEERMLFTSLFLAKPDVRVVYVTSLPVDEAIVDYYLGFLGDPVEARRRLAMVSLDDPGPRALSEKLLVRPDVLARIGALAGGPDDAYILPFNMTAAEHEVSAALGLAIYGPHPDLAQRGSKTGSRQVAARAGVAVLAGAENLHSLDEVAASVATIRADRSDVQAVVVKLNNGFSGQGNAIVTVGDTAGPIADWPTIFCAAAETWPSFEAKLAAEGGIVEELVRGDAVASPSVQMRIAPNGIHEVVSTHDQLLGGPENQVYLGCRYPADESYRSEIEAAGARVADVLADDGVIGSFGIDFVVTPQRVTLSEINLRMGGTTHPYWMARLVTGRHDVHYLASDNLKSASLVGRTPAEVLALVNDAGLAFDPASGTGVCLHLLGAVPQFGKLGATCIAEDPAAAQSLYDRLVAALVGVKVDTSSTRVRTPQPVPPLRM